MSGFHDLNVNSKNDFMLHALYKLVQARQNYAKFINEPINCCNRLIFLRIFEPNNLNNWLMKYIWQLANFPKFKYDATKLLPLVEESAVLIGEVRGIMKGFTPALQDEVSAQVMLSEAIKTSEIEGEYFSREDVMSSLMMNLGLIDYVLPTKNKNADSIAKLMIEVRKNYNQPLTLKMILQWHKILMSHYNNIHAGALRSSSVQMQVISGRYGDIQVHYEAPPSKDLPQLLDNFFQWYKTFEDSTLGTIGEAIILSALSHLYFETLHPFEDGNGRVGRAITEKVLAEKLQSPLFISLSTCIEKNKITYYDEIKKAQRNLEVTDWLVYSIQVLIQSLKETVVVVQFVRKKTEFYDRYNKELNERQRKVVNKMFNQGISGFEGGMTAKKYMSINKTTKSTATRDLQELIDKNVFLQKGAGRSTSYDLNLN